MWVGIALILLAPAVLFSADYLGNSYPFSNPTRQSSITESGSGWQATITIKHPAFIVTGQQIPANVTVGIATSNQNVTVQLNSLVAQLRVATHLNSTTNLVEGWTVLSSVGSRINMNITSSGQQSRILELTAFYPPTASFLDQVSPSARMAVNGMVNMTIYTGAGNQSSVDFATLSILDDRPFYQNQLASIRSAASWLNYQLIAAVAALSLYVALRPSGSLPVDQIYMSKIEAYVAERKIAHLEELRKSARIPEGVYDELKHSYEKEVAAFEHGETPRSGAP